MDILDDKEKIENIDKSGVYKSVVELPLQCKQAYEDSEKIQVPDSYKDVDNLVMTGMGGSGLGARIIESVFSNNLKYPLVRVNDYDLPSWANEKTLVFCSSYSGTTEETVSNAKQAIEAKCKWVAISSGGTLLELANKNKVPYYKINPVHNPSSQPRMAIGYSVVGQLMLAQKAGVCNFSNDDLGKMIEAMKGVIKENNIDVSLSKNQAKTLAQKCFEKIVVLVSARHLEGSVHTTKNQLNENAKNFSARFDIPELNHHLMEGLKNPKSNKENLYFVFLESDLYPKRIQQRIKITEKVVEKQDVKHFVWRPDSKDPLAQVFEFIQFGAFFNFYLGMLYGIDPAPIAWVDYFKKTLGQPLGK